MEQNRQQFNIITTCIQTKRDLFILVNNCHCKNIGTGFKIRQQPTFKMQDLQSKLGSIAMTRIYWKKNLFMLPQSADMFNLKEKKL